MYNVRVMTLHYFLSYYLPYICKIVCNPEIHRHNMSNNMSNNMQNMQKCWEGLFKLQSYRSYFAYTPDFADVTRRAHRRRPVEAGSPLTPAGHHVKCSTGNLNGCQRRAVRRRTRMTLSLSADAARAAAGVAAAAALRRQAGCRATAATYLPVKRRVITHSRVTVLSHGGYPCHD